VKEVKLLEEDGNAKQLNIKTKTMEKGHYGQYTGNARHSRKEEMIHDRELIYDAKKQLHHADQDYKHDSPAHRALVGNQDKLPGHLKKAISDAPAQMNADLAYDPINDRADSPMSMYGKKESPAAMYGKKVGTLAEQNFNSEKRMGGFAEDVTSNKARFSKGATVSASKLKADPTIKRKKESPAKNMKNVLSGKQRY
jgi:hypothetical protein